MTGNPSERPVGVREVARLAGVSTQTVSRVLNQHPNVRDATRQRVLDAMAELDYRLNNAARSLGTKSSHTLGIIASDAELYGPSVGIAAVEAAARQSGRWVTTAYADAADSTAVLDAAQHLRAQGVDGIVVIAPHATSYAALLRAGLGIPLGALHGEVGAAAQRVGAELAVAHLIALGHRRIAHLAGPRDWIEATARAEGYEAALTAAGLEPAGTWLGDWSAAAGFARAEEIADAAAAASGPTAVFVANDQMALGLIAGVRRLGLSVPGDVSVAGFDDNPDAAFYSPALTTVRVDIAAEAQRCVRDLVGEHPAAVDGEAITAPPTLVPRESTAAPRTSPA